MTRAAPARLLGLADRGHLAPGARADIAVYRPARIWRRCSVMPSLCSRTDDLVVRQGTPIGAPAGHALAVQPGFDASIERRLGGWLRSCLRRVSQGVRCRCQRSRAVRGCCMPPMTRNGVRIDDTFAEAFDMRGTALLITAGASRWARQAASDDDGLRHLGHRLRLRGGNRPRGAGVGHARRAPRHPRPAVLPPRPVSCKSNFRRGSDNAC